MLALQRRAGNAAVERLLQDVGLAHVQRYRTSPARDGGDMIGEPSGCHLHINIGKPHFKVGTDDSSRINFGNDMNLKRMQHAYEVLLANHDGAPGYDDCKEYFEEHGCVEPVAESPVGILKTMLLKWGGLSEDMISFYTDVHGNRTERAFEGDELDDVILAAEEEIRTSDKIYAKFLEQGGVLDGMYGDIDSDAMAQEQNKIYEDERKSVKSRVGK